MADITDKTRFRAIGFPEAKGYDASSLDTANSTYDEKGPLPGIPEDQDGSAMVLKSTGSQTASSELRVRTQRGGFPGLRKTSATAIWQRNGDTSWMGWDPPTSITGYEWLTDQGGNSYPACITLQSGNILRVGASDNGAKALATTSLYTASTNTWGGFVTAFTPDINTYNLWPDLVQLPNGKILLFVLWEHGTANEYRLSIRQSTDDGATWSDYNAQPSLIDVLSFTTTSTTPTRMRVAHNPTSGDYLMLVWETKSSGTYTKALRQLYSSDGAATFEQIVHLSAGSNDDNQSITGDVVVSGGQYVVVSANPTATTASHQGYHVFRLANAAQVIDDSSSVRIEGQIDLSSLVAAEHRCALGVDSRGVVWFYGQNPGATIDQEFVAFSTDNGASFDTAAGGRFDGTENTGSWFAPGVSTVHPTSYAVCSQRGRMLMLCNHDSPTTTSDDGYLTSLWLGGFTDVTLPWRSSPYPTVQPWSPSTRFAAGWDVDYLPFELPANDGWTRSTSGTASDTIVDGQLTLSTTTGTVYYYMDETDVKVSNYEMQGQVTSGTMEILRVRMDDSTNRFIFSVELTATTVAIVDQPSGSGGTPNTLASDTHGGGNVQIRVGFRNGEVELWWRDADTSEERTWTKIEGTATDIGTASGVTDRVFFGAVVSGTMAGTVDRFSYSTSTEAGDGLEGFTNPDDLRGISYGASPDSAAYIADGVEIYAVDGPTATGEDWNIDTRYTSPIANIFPGTVASPSVGWESATATAKMAIAWDMDGSSASGEDSAALGAQFIYLAGINFRQAQVSVWNNTTASWTDVAEIDNTLSVAFDRYGDQVWCDILPAADAPYLEFNELVGGFFEFPNGDVRPIVRNTNGNLNGANRDGREARIVISDVDGGESATGTGKIWFPNALIVFGSRLENKIRIEINDDATPVAPFSGTFKIGTAVHGYLSVMGKDNSFERTITIRPNTEITTSGDGRRRSRTRNVKARRVVELSWPAVSVSDFRADGQPQATVFTSSMGTPLGSTIADDPLRWHGLIEEMKGGDRLCLYMPRLNAWTFGSPETYVQNRCTGAILGRVVGGVSLTQEPYGDEHYEDGYKLTGVTIEEEL